jgi:hypothetical protein
MIQDKEPAAAVVDRLRQLTNTRRVDRNVVTIFSLFYFHQEN